MAAPIKQGLDYFPLEVDLDNDDKLGMIIAEFDHKGEFLFIKLLSWIYKNDGYYIEWNEEHKLKFLRRYKYCGFTMGFINEVVPRCVKWELFNKVVFDRFQILTSTRIQTTWLDASRKRISRTYKPEIWLIPENDKLTAEETPKKAEETDKVKETKVKETKVKKSNPLVVSDETPVGPSKGDYEKLKDELNGSDLTTVVTRMKEFLSKRPVFFDPYMDYWNLLVKKSSIPALSKETDDRIKKLKTRLKEPAFDFVEICRLISSSHRLKNESTWFSFDWVIDKEKNYVRILEKIYNQ